MTNIPMARERIQHVLNVRGLGLDDWTRQMLLDALALMTRKPKPKRSLRNATPMTPELREAICRHAAQYPRKVQHEIAAHFNVSPGRVCEVLA